ncbi:MAG: class I SAM-dependent methyltransferase [Fischerella sp.]|nr:class I SAM-dependent methyltransferase [Fischerella sp.]
MMSSVNQDTVFLNQEADAWFERNADSATTPVSSAHRVLQALRQVTLPRQGMLLDVGGASGKVAAGFQREYPEWKCCVVELSGKAITAGRAAFPQIEFYQGSITQSEGLPVVNADVVIVSAVFHFVERQLLSRAICNVDFALKNGGFLVISDFDSPFLRANAYKHYAGLYTYKQDYAEIFRQLGIYQVVYRLSETLVDHSTGDADDPYDRQWVTTVLKKDIYGRYFRKE